jgi:hypothetical protein
MIINAVIADSAVIAGNGRGEGENSQAGILEL